MAKKKKRKEEKKPASYQVELLGMVLLLVSIIGICEFGIVGTFFKCFAAFLIGEWYILLFILLSIVGVYMIIKRDKPKMLISCYHKSEDYFTIPLKVLEFNPNYKLYIRHFPALPAWDTCFYFI